jgi:hypothetical protein
VRVWRDLRRCWQYLVLKMKKRSFTMINIKKMRLTMFAASIVAAGALTGCFNDDSADAGPNSTSFNNGAALGALVGAICTYKNNSGTMLATKGRVVTDNDGTAPVEIDNLVAGDFPVIVSCAGGTYYDEAANVFRSNAGESIQSIIPSLAALAEVGNRVGVNTLTDMATKLYNSAAPADKTSSGALAAFKEIGRVMAPGLVGSEAGGELNLLGSSAPVKNDSPSLANNAASKLAVYLAGLAQVANDAGKTPAQLGELLADAITAGQSVDTTVPNGGLGSKLKTAATAYAKDKAPAALADDTEKDQSGSGGSASKPKSDGTNDGGATGGTGGTGATGANGGQP